MAFMKIESEFTPTTAALVEPHGIIYRILLTPRPDEFGGYEYDVSPRPSLPDSGNDEQKADFADRHDLLQPCHEICAMCGYVRLRPISPDAHQRRDFQGLESFAQTPERQPTLGGKLLLDTFLGWVVRSASESRISGLDSGGDKQTNLQSNTGSATNTYAKKLNGQHEVHQRATFENLFSLIPQSLDRDCLTWTAWVKSGELDFCQPRNANCEDNRELSLSSRHLKPAMDILVALRKRDILEILSCPSGAESWALHYCQCLPSSGNPFPRRAMNASSGANDSRKDCLRALRQAAPVAEYDFRLFSLTITMILTSFRPLSVLELARGSLLLSPSDTEHRYSSHPHGYASDNETSQARYVRDLIRLIQYHWSKILTISVGGIVMFTSNSMVRLLQETAIPGLQIDHHALARACLSEINQLTSFLIGDSAEGNPERPHVQLATHSAGSRFNGTTPRKQTLAKKCTAQQILELLLNREAHLPEFDSACPFLYMFSDFAPYAVRFWKAHYLRIQEVGSVISAQVHDLLWRHFSISHRESLGHAPGTCGSDGLCARNCDTCLRSAIFECQKVGFTTLATVYQQTRDSSPSLRAERVKHKNTNIPQSTRDSREDSVFGRSNLCTKATPTIS